MVILEYNVISLVMGSCYEGYPLCRECVEEFSGTCCIPVFCGQ